MKFGCRYNLTVEPFIFGVILGQRLSIFARTSGLINVLVITINNTFGWRYNPKIAPFIFVLILGQRLSIFAIEKEDKNVVFYTHHY